MLELFHIQFESPWMLVSLIIIPLLAYYFFKNKKSDVATLSMPSVEPIGKTMDWLDKLRPILNILRLLALTCLIIALARPRYTDFARKVNTNKGVDIIMTVDVSTSMNDTDIAPSRLEALKVVASKFAEERKLDRIGLVTYAGEAFAKVPLTTDRRILIEAIQSLNSNEMSRSGTAIGHGLGTAVSHLKNSKAKSKVVILLTDGADNASTLVSPGMAADMAAHYGIKVYTIGLGTDGGGGIMNPFMMGDGLNEPLLKDIAQKTGGFYFRATSNTSLQNIYDEINRMEKTDIDDIKYYTYEELFRQFLLYAFILLVIEALLRMTIFRSFI